MMRRLDVPEWWRRIERSAWVLPAAALVALALIGVNETGYQQARKTLGRLVQMAQVRLDLNLVLRRSADAESGQRGFLLTGRQEYLEPFSEAQQDLDEALKRLEAQYRDRDEPTASHMLGELDGAVRAKLQEMSESIRLQVEGRPDDARQLMLTDIGRTQMQDVRRLSEQLVGVENEHIRVGIERIYAGLQVNRLGVGALTLLGLFALAMYLRRSRALSAQRREQQRLLEAERDRLEVEVRRRTEQLTELAAHLQTAREDERYRLARELHDELGALLTAAKLDAARIKPKLAGAAPEVLDRLAHLTQTLNSGIALKRRIIEDLRPSSLTNLGLVPALEIHTREVSERLEIPVRVSLEPVSLSASAQLTAYRLVQEGLTNVAKYAKARQVDVRLATEGGWARIEVQDDGIGFDANSRPASTHGLLGMRYRVEAERGQFQVHSSPGGGTRLVALLPLQPQTEDATAV